MEISWSPLKFTILKQSIHDIETILMITIVTVPKLKCKKNTFSMKCWERFFCDKTQNKFELTFRVKWI